VKRRCKRPPLWAARPKGKANPTWSKIKYDAAKATRLNPDTARKWIGISIGLIATSPGRPLRPGKINDYRAGRPVPAVARHLMGGGGQAREGWRTKSGL